MAKKFTQRATLVFLLGLTACGNSGPIVSFEAGDEKLIVNVSDIKSVKVDKPRSNAPVLNFCLHDSAKAQLKNFTKKHLRKPMVIIIADQPVTSAIITSPNTSGCITTTSRYAELYAEKMEP